VVEQPRRLRGHLLAVVAHDLDDEQRPARRDQAAYAGDRAGAHRAVQRLDRVDLHDQVERADQVRRQVEQVGHPVVHGAVLVALPGRRDRGRADVEGGGRPAERGEVLGVRAVPHAHDHGPLAGAVAAGEVRREQVVRLGAVPRHRHLPAGGGGPELVVPARRLAVRDRGHAELVGQLVPVPVLRHGLADFTASSSSGDIGWSQLQPAMLLA
jgi:hypothetical protein